MIWPCKKNGSLFDSGLFSATFKLWLWCLFGNRTIWECCWIQNWTVGGRSKIFYLLWTVFVNDLSLFLQTIDIPFLEVNKCKINDVFVWQKWSDRCSFAIFNAEIAKILNLKPKKSTWNYQADVNAKVWRRFYASNIWFSKIATKRMTNTFLHL